MSNKISNLTYDQKPWPDVSQCNALLWILILKYSHAGLNESTNMTCMYEIPINGVFNGKALSPRNLHYPLIGLNSMSGYHAYAISAVVCQSVNELVCLE